MARRYATMMPMEIRDTCHVGGLETAKMLHRTSILLDRLDAVGPTSIEIRALRDIMIEFIQQETGVE